MEKKVYVELPPFTGRNVPIKTRFFVKPQLMQLHSSYVVTDPNGYTVRG